MVSDIGLSIRNGLVGVGTKSMVDLPFGPPFMFGSGMASYVFDLVLKSVVSLHIRTWAVGVFA